jgi:hypothetical protein
VRQTWEGGKMRKWEIMNKNNCVWCLKIHHLFIIQRIIFDFETNTYSMTETNQTIKQ